jgi:5'-nucleotidase (lipoprotein e(P4) family)
MKALSRIFLIALITASIPALAKTEVKTGTPVPSAVAVSKSEYIAGATIWYQNSAEARALCYQAFNLAKMRLDIDLLENAGDKTPRAVVVDVDETVLDNSPYEARLIEKGTAYPEGWRQWIDEATARPVPGALEFLKYAHSKGARVFYVTNRRDDEKPGTVKNLERAGFPGVSAETVVTRSDVSSKEPRRMKIAKDHRIVLLVGDNLADFAEGFAEISTQERFKNTDQARELWGTRFIVLPNPMYGEWEGAIYKNNWKLSEETKAGLRRASLRLK